MLEGDVVHGTRTARRGITLGVIASLLAMGGPVVTHAAGQTLGCAASYDAADLPAAVPDHGEIESSLVVPAGQPAQDVNVRIAIRHPFDADLTIELIAPSEVAIVLAEGVGSWGDDFIATTFDDEAASSIISDTAPFTGSFRPIEQLSNLDAPDGGGTWRLRVTDRHSGYVGELTAFGLDFLCEDVASPTGQSVRVAPFRRTRSIRVRWAAGSDTGSGVASRDVHYLAAAHGGDFGLPVAWRTETSATTGRVAGIPGTTYCFAERLRDGAGNLSTFSAQRCTATPIDDRDLDRSGRWRRKRDMGFYARTYSLTRTRGAALRLAVEGEAFALLASTCPDCGKVKVFLGSELLRRISLTSRRLRPSRLFPLRTFEHLQTGTIRIVFVSRRGRAMIDGLVVRRPPVDGLPDTYARLDAAGAPPPEMLPDQVPQGTEDTVGAVILVDTAADVSDGNTSSVAALEASNGVDGDISLREAIQATNNESSPHTVHFDPALDGATISLASGLPGLEGGGLFIDGDLDGDGNPNLTIANESDGFLFAFSIFSSHNRLHALRLEGFDIGVGFPIGIEVSFEDNVISGLVIVGGGGGILQSGTGLGDDRDSTWSDTRVVGNTIEAESSGIEFNIHRSQRVTLQRVTIVGNVVRIDEDAGSDSSFGVNVASGLGAVSDDDLVTEVLVAFNLVEGTPEAAYRVSADGGTAPGGNVTEDVRFIGNHALLGPLNRVGGFTTSGLLVQAGDDFDPSHENRMRRVEIRANRFSGHGGAGVRLAGACCAATDGLIEDVEIVENVIEGVTTAGVARSQGIALVASGGSPEGTDPPQNNAAKDVAVLRNSISIVNDAALTEGEITSGGVVVLGAEGAGPGNAVQNVDIIDNRITTELLGLSFIGGWHDAHANVVTDVTARSNLIAAGPSLMSGLVPGIRGMAVIGGTGRLDPGWGAWSSTNNVVCDLSLEHNLVAGMLDDLFLEPNLSGGAGDASGNTAALTCPP